MVVLIAFFLRPTLDDLWCEVMLSRVIWEITLCPNRKQINMIKNRLMIIINELFSYNTDEKSKYR